MLRTSEYNFILLTLLFGCGLNSGRDEIHHASSGGDVTKLIEIIESDNNAINKRSHLGETPLYLAATKGHLDIVQYLLDHGADIEAGNNLDERPLAKAAKFGHYGVAEMLLQYGAEPNSTDSQGLTALHWTIDNGSLKLVKLLVNGGADPTILSIHNHAAKDRALELFEVGEEAKYLVIYEFLAKAEGKKG